MFTQGQHVRSEHAGTKDEAFGKIKPICVRLSQVTFRKDELLILQDPQLKQLLQDLIQNLDILITKHKSLSGRFGDYVFVPISAMLKTCKSLPDPIATLVFEILARIIDVSWSLPATVDRNTFSQLLSLSTFLISTDLENVNLPNKPDEFKIASIRLLRVLYSTAAFKEWDANMLPAIAHSITILLTLLENSNMSIQLESSKTLRLLYRVINDGEMLSNVVPGNVSTFAKILSRPGLTTHVKVTSDVLSTMSELLCMVYGDSSLETFIKTSTGNTAVEVKNPGKHRTTKWLNATSIQLKRALEPTFSKLTKRNNEKLNGELFEACVLLLNKCHNSLYGCREVILKTALTVARDNVFALERFKNDIAAFMRDNNIQVETNFEEINQYNIVNNALRILDTDQLEEYQISKTVAYGIYDSLKTHLLSLDKTENINLIKVTSSEVNYLVTSGSLNNSEVSIIPKISSTAYENVTNILLQLGSKMSASSIQEQIIEFLSIESDVLKNSNEALWIASTLLTGYKNTDISDFLAHDSDPISCQYDIIEMANERVSILSNQTELNELQRTNLTMNLFAMKQMIILMGKDFKDEMLDYIYNVIECFASDDENTRFISGNILQYLANEFYQGAMLNLFQDNVNYIIDGISVRLDNCLFHRAYMVLRVVIKVSGYDLVERLNDILEKLFWMLGYYHGYDDLCTVLLNLFIEISYKIQYTFLSKSSGQSIEIKTWNQDSFKPWGMSNIEQVLNVLDQEKTAADDYGSIAEVEPPEQTAEEFFKERFEKDSDDEDEDEEDAVSENNSSVNNGEAKDEMKWESPISRDAYMLLLRFWTYADRLLTHSSRSVRNKCLDLLLLLCPMLSTQQAVFLPNVAKVWDIVVRSAISEDLAQVGRSYELLNSLVLHTDSFLMKRVLDMWKLFSARDTMVSKMLSPISKSTRVHTTNTLQLQAYLRCSKLLITCMNQFGLQLPDHITIEMCKCLQSLPKDNNSCSPTQIESKHVTNILLLLNLRSQ